MPACFSPGEIFATRYKVIETRRGGMGEVAICRDISAPDDPLVAIKAIAPELVVHEEARRRFEREAEAWMAVGRAGMGFVLPLSEVIVKDSSFWLKMPYCGGGSLSDRLRTGPLSRGEAAEYATELLLGLYQLNVELGIVHRDLKPGNVLIDDEGRLQIADLGLVKFADGDIARSMRNASGGDTQFGDFVGTLLYAAPEQLLGLQPLDWRADMWAFGIIVHELFTGSRPFPDEDASTHLKTILSPVARRLDDLAARSNAEVAAAVAKCLAPNPNDRHATFNHLVQAWDSGIRTADSPAVGMLRRDRRIALPPRSIAHAPWTGLFFPERLGKDTGLVSFDVSAINGVVEARDYYRLDRYEESIAAARKTLGRLDDPQSNVSRLLKGQLSDVPSFDHPAYDRGLRSRVVPSRPAALKALTWTMRSLVSLIESREDNRRWLAELRLLSEHVTVARLQDAEVLTLAAQLYVHTEEYATASRIAQEALRLSPVDVVAGWVAFQAVLRTGDIAAARAFAMPLIEQYVAQEGSLHHDFAIRLAYAVQDTATVIRLAPEALRREPGNAEVLGRLTAALLMTRRHEDARHYLQALRRVAPNAPQTLQLAKALGA